MKTVDQIKLSEFFRQFKPTHVLGSTYTVSPVFFEANLWHHISKEKLQGCVILCDRKGFQRAMQEAGALRAAGRSYSLVAAPVAAAFHPKVWLMVDEEKMAVLSGSGNLTQSGFIDNLELFETVTIDQSGDGKRFAEEVLRFVEGLGKYWTEQEEMKIPAARLVRDIRNRIQSLIGSMNSGEEQDEKPHFLSNFGGTFPDQLASAGNVERLWVAAPYFGGSLSGIKSLQEALAPSETVICPATHGDGGIDLPLEKVQRMPNTRLASLDLNKKLQKIGKTFAHYKLLGLEIADGKKFSFTGSVNGTHNALMGANVEAGILRRLTEDDFYKLFAESKSPPPNVQADLEYECEAKRWIGLWAVANHQGIEIVGANAHKRFMPLSSVRFSIKASHGQFFTLREQIFTDSNRLIIRWNEFEGLCARPPGIVILRFEGKDSDGDECYGLAMLEDFASLTSTPGQRNAFQGALTLLEGEGLPDSGELAAVFSLLTSALDLVELEKRSSGSDSSEGSSDKDEPQDERIPVWPPVSDNIVASVGSAGSAIDQISWFQRLLSQFLIHKEDTVSKNKTGSETDNSSADTMIGSADLDSEEESEQESEANLKALERACAARWKQALDAVGSLETRFRQLLISDQDKDGVLAVCVGIVLTSLALKKMILRSIEPTTFSLPSNGQLASRLIAIVLDDRKQDDNYVRPKNFRYHDEIFPPILEDLSENLGVRLDQQLGEVLFAFLAYCHADPGVTFPTYEWLEFRYYVESQQSDLQDWSVGASRCAECYLINDVEGVSIGQFRRSMQKLLDLSMESIPGWRVLSELWNVGTGKANQVSPETKDTLKETLSTFDVRMEMLEEPKDLFISISRHGRRCNNPKCRKRGLADPIFSKLRSIHPVICPSCGYVLTPKILAETFFNHGEKD